MHTSEQQTMERRYSLPYNWLLLPHTRRFRYKDGLLKSVLKLLPPLAGKKVLDAGCGDGWYSGKIAALGAQVIGIDYSEKAVQFAKLIVPQASFETGSITNLPFGEGAFDCICSIQVLEHIPPDDVPKAAGELARVLKKDGVCVISVPSLRRPLSKAHFQHFSPDSISAIMSTHFSVQKIFGYKKKSTVFLFLEKISENRFIHSPFLGKILDIIFFKYFAYTSAEKGDNLVVMLVSKK